MSNPISKSRVIPYGEDANSQLSLVIAQVAHDIRSPVAVLNMIASGLIEYNTETQAMIRDATIRINDIANSLLMKFRNKQEVLHAEYSVHDLIDNIGKIISEKRVLYKDIAVEFKYTVDQKIQNGSVGFQVGDFMRVISNILNNAVESIVGNGLIEVNLVTKGVHVVIEVADNGCGMPPEVLERVCHEGHTTKEDGCGLGLYHAMSVLRGFGGELDIRSTIGVGTEIILTLPYVWA